MHILKRPRLALVALTAALTALPLVLLATPAHASVPEAWCSGNGTGRCMNRYQGGETAGTDVIAYTHDYDNGEAFGDVPVDLCAGSSVVTSTCPFTNTSFDSRYKGDSIVVIPAYNDTNPNLCVGDDGTDFLAELVACPNLNNGQGGGDGTIEVISSTNYAVSRQVTNDDDALSFVGDVGLGQQIQFNIPLNDINSAEQWQAAYP